MTQIYEQHLWGGTEFDFYSGEGSHKPKIVEPYIEAVSDFLASYKNNLTVCDLGCGDFNIGNQLLNFTKKYHAIDVVEVLIARNKQHFNADHLEFYCLDISTDKLPKADCVILRQVLQHLSNSEIVKIAKKLSNYKYIIITEHLPTGTFTPNRDIISGQGNRLKYNSGVNLLYEPFNLKIRRQSELCNTVVDNGKSEIRTTLYIL